MCWFYYQFVVNNVNYRMVLKKPGSMRKTGPKLNLEMYGKNRQTRGKIILTKRRCGAMKNLLKQILALLSNTETKPLHFTDSTTYFEGVELDAIERGQLSI